MVTKKQMLILTIMAFGAFTAGVLHSDFFSGIEQEANFLTASIAEREKDSEDLRVVFTEDEARGLRQMVSEVRAILSKSDSDNNYESVKKGLIGSTLQSDLIRMEKEWRKREGAWIVVKLLESVRIKSQLFLQNAYLLERLNENQSDMRSKTIERMRQLIVGIELSNDTLSDKVDEGTSTD